MIVLTASFDVEALIRLMPQLAARMQARNKLTYNQALPQYDRAIPPCDGLSRRSEIAVS